MELAEQKKMALAEFKGEPIGNVEFGVFGEFYIGEEEYKVLTEEEAAEEAKADIAESVWAFNSAFLVDHSKVLEYEHEEIIQEIQGKCCESCNEMFKALLDDFEQFVEDAIAADGRGHFLARYDSKEHTAEVKGETFYIYQN